MAMPACYYHRTSSPQLLTVRSPDLQNKTPHIPHIYPAEGMKCPRTGPIKSGGEYLGGWVNLDALVKKIGVLRF
jgi:hypothetical protein